MRQSYPNVYAAAMLRDADNHYVPIPISERFVQCIWYDQRIQTDDLRTSENQPVRIVFPGWWNLEAGPDFRHATIQIGHQPETAGDVEIHLRSDDWFHHGHDRDPLYNNVVLHVVLWDSGNPRPPITHSGDIIPQVILQHQLEAPIESLYDEIDIEAYPHNVGNHAGRCGVILRDLPAARIHTLLENAGDERLAAKTRKFVRWIHRRGPEQAFYEGWMEALGFKSNKQGFRLLAQQLPLADIMSNGHTHAIRAALFFGVANFLPTDRPKPNQPDHDRIIKRLWGAWWKHRPEYQFRVIPAKTWRFSGVRPANHPHRRLAAALILLKKHPNLAERVLGAIETGGDPSQLFLHLRDEYWSTHFTLGGKPQTEATELIGPSRAREILTNVILPFASAHAQLHDNTVLLTRVHQLYCKLKPSSSNSIVRLASQQLFDRVEDALPHIQTERRQQGLIQVFQDFCLNDKSGCQTCQFPELIRRWRTTPPLTTE